MTLFYTSLESEMQDALRLVRSEKDQHKIAAKSVHLINDFIIRLRTYTRENPFPDQKQEIRYFKFYAPRFYGRLFYYLKVCEIATKRLHLSPERMETVLKAELAAIDEFYLKHEDFCKIYYLKNTRLDDRLFVRNQEENQKINEVEIIMGNDFSVGCYYAARLYSNLALRKYLKRELDRKELLDQQQKPSSLTWTDSKTDAGELIIALYLKRSFNGGKAQLKQIVEGFETAFNIKIGNISVLWQEIKRRKIAKTKFLDSARDLLNKKAEDEE